METLRISSPIEGIEGIDGGTLVVGAGGHAKVIADILLRSGVVVRGFLDDDPRLWGTMRLGLPVLGGIASWPPLKPAGLAMGIGHNEARRRVAEQLGPSAPWVNAIHPTAVVAPSVHLGRGLIIAAMGVVNPDSTIGDYAIINTGATVDHDCVIGPYAHLAPGVHLSGNVHVGEGALIGIGATLAPGCIIGCWAVVGAGAVVVRNVPDNVVAKGVPARW